MSTKVAFIGLGVMGYPMAGHLKNSGFDVTVFNRTEEKAHKWVKQFGGTMALTPAQAAKDAEFVFVCVGNDDDLREVTLQPTGVLATAQMTGLLGPRYSPSSDIQPLCMCISPNQFSSPANP